jgi:hypothetical protein
MALSNRLEKGISYEADGPAWDNGRDCRGPLTGQKPENEPL